MEKKNTYNGNCGTGSNLSCSHDGKVGHVDENVADYHKRQSEHDGSWKIPVRKWRTNPQHFIDFRTSSYIKLKIVHNTQSLFLGDIVCSTVDLHVGVFHFLCDVVQVIPGRYRQKVNKNKQRNNFFSPQKECIDDPFCWTYIGNWSYIPRRLRWTGGIYKIDPLKRFLARISLHLDKGEHQNVDNFSPPFYS